MNKKQLIVAWIMSIVSFPIFWNSCFSLSECIRITIPILILGGLLIYTLRDKEK